MERGWSAEDDVAPVRVLRDALRLWRRVIGGDSGSLRSPAVARRAQDAPEMPPRGRAGRPVDDPHAYVRVGIDPRRIHLD